MKPSRRLRLELQMFIQTQEEQTGAAQSTPSSLIFMTRTALSKPPLQQLPFMQLIGGLVERGSLVPHLGSNLRKGHYSCKRFKTTILRSTSCGHRDQQACPEPSRTLDARRCKQGAGCKYHTLKRLRGR
jgi:hypothetical protein